MNDIPPELIMKTCTRCQIELPATSEYFYKRGKRLISRCKVCNNAASKVWMLANIDKKKAIDKAYREANPGKTRAAIRIWQKANPDKKNAFTKAWRDANKEQVKASTKVYKQANSDKVNGYARKRLALLRGNEHIPYTEQEVLNMYGTNCHICLEPIDFNAPRGAGKHGWEMGLHIDHLTPISKGGPDTLENVRPSHGKCNLTKHTKINYKNLQARAQRSNA